MKQQSEFVPPGKGMLEFDGTLLDRMIEGKPYWPRREIPGWPEPIRIRPLGRGREQQCHVEAIKWARSQGVDPDRGAGRELYEERAAQHILYEALVTGDSDPDHPDRAKPLARDVDEFIDHPVVTDMMIDFLWREYLDVKMRCSPDIKEMPDAVREEIIAEIKKNPSRTSLEPLPRPHVEDLLIFSVSRDTG